MISERAMLAAIHISIWTATKHDRKVSRDVASQHGAHQGVGRYNKQLQMGAAKLEELRSLAGQIRQHFYKITLPWSDEGFRLLPSHFYFDLTARMREFETAFSLGVNQDLAPVMRLTNSGNDHQALVRQQAASPIDHIPSLPASQQSTLIFPGPEQISQKKRSTYRTSGM